MGQKSTAVAGRRRDGFHPKSGRKTRDRLRCSGQSLGVSKDEAEELLSNFKQGKISQRAVLRRLQSAPFDDLKFAKVDTHRSLRKGFPEVIFGAGKTPAQVAEIADRLMMAEKRLLITRVGRTHHSAVRKKLPKAKFHETAGCITIEISRPQMRPGTIAVVSAGTSDLSIAEEAAVTADIMGNRVERIYDVGVAGLHRLMSQLETLQKASVLIVVAGMEGALPSVVAGLVDRPVIAVPTSVGYGAAFNGLAALLGMLTSCGSGVTVVNIDNGFGAAYSASQIVALANEKQK